MIQTVWQPLSWSPSGCYLAKSAETKVAAYRIHFLLTEPTDLNLQCQKSWVYFCIVIPLTDCLQKFWQTIYFFWQQSPGLWSLHLRGISQPVQPAGQLSQHYGKSILLSSTIRNCQCSSGCQDGEENYSWTIQHHTIWTCVHRRFRNCTQDDPREQPSWTPYVLQDQDHGDLSTICCWQLELVPGILQPCRFVN